MPSADPSETLRLDALRNRDAALSAENQWSGQVDSFFCMGKMTIAQIDALGGNETHGMSFIAKDAGTPAASGSDNFAINDIGEWDSTESKWVKTVARDAQGYIPAGTRVLVATTAFGTTLYDPFTASDANSLIEWSGGSDVVYRRTPLADGRAVQGRKGVGAGCIFSKVTVSGAGTFWAPTGYPFKMINKNLFETLDVVYLLSLDPDGVVLADNVIQPEITAVGGSGGSDAGTLAIALKGRSGAAISREANLLLYASNSQYGGSRDPNANISIGTPTKGSVLHAAASSGWWIVLTDTNGEFAAPTTNSVDETVWFSATASDITDIADYATLAVAGLADNAVWSA